MRHEDVVLERTRRETPMRLLVRDRREHLQRHWARGEVYEYDLFGAAPARRAAGWVYDRVSRAVRNVAREGMLRYVAERYRGGTFLDVGSCIGNHTLFFAVACGADLVVSFEPVPELLAHQRALLALNDVRNVTLVNAALGDACGTIRFAKSNLRRNAGMSRVSAAGATEVPLTTLDDALARVSVTTPVRLLKVDVEGYGVPLLRGARATLRAHRPDVFVECATRAELAGVEAELARAGLVRNRTVVFNLTPTYLFQPA